MAQLPGQSTHGRSTLKPPPPLLSHRSHPGASAARSARVKSLDTLEAEHSRGVPYGLRLQIGFRMLFLVLVTSTKHSWIIPAKRCRICQLERWLPRWRIGKETWVCIADSENKTCQISSKTSCCDIGKSLTNQQHAKFLSSCRPLLRQSAFGRQDLGDIVASLEVGLGFFLDAAKDPDGFLMLAPRLHGV